MSHHLLKSHVDYVLPGCCVRCRWLCRNVMSWLGGGDWSPTLAGPERWNNIMIDLYWTEDIKVFYLTAFLLPLPEINISLPDPLSWRVSRHPAHQSSVISELCLKQLFTCRQDAMSTPSPCWWPRPWTQSPEEGRQLPPRTLGLGVVGLWNKVNWLL